MSAPLRIRDVNGMSVTVGMSTPAGGATTLYSDSACTTSLGTSTTLTADTTLYVKAAGEYTLSVKVLGVELAGGAVQLVDRQPISFDVDADVLPARIEAGDGGAYAPIAATWQPSTAYKAGQLVVNAGSLYAANADFTSGASFNAANWTAIGGGGGSFQPLLTPLVKTATYAMAAADALILASGTFTVTLPTVATATVGKRFAVKNMGTGVVTVAPASGTIDGAATITLSTQYQSRDFVTDGTNWFQV